MLTEELHTERVRITLPGPLAEPVPQVEKMTAETLAQLLERIDYKEPILRKCSVEGCDALTFKTYCDRCVEEMKGTPVPVPWGAVVKWLAVAVVLIAVVTWGVTK